MATIGYYLNYSFKATPNQPEKRPPTQKTLKLSSPILTYTPVNYQN